MSRNNKGQFVRGNQEGNRFSARNQPTIKGRKKRLYGQITDKFSKIGDVISKHEFFNIMAYIIELSPAELKKIAKDETIPVWVVVLITSLLTDCRYGRLNTLEFILDRILGKTPDSVNVIQNNTIHIQNIIDLSILTPEEGAFLDQIIDRMTKSKSMKQAGELTGDNQKMGDS